jgi:hypothetical protein
MNETQKQALTEVLALRRLTHENNVVTRRAQNVVLQALTPADLVAVSAALAEHQEKHGW